MINTTEGRITLILRLFKKNLTSFKQTSVVTMRFIAELVIVTESLVAIKLFRGKQKQSGTNNHSG